MQLLGMLDVSDWSDFLHATMLFCDIKDKSQARCRHPKEYVYRNLRESRGHASRF